MSGCLNAISIILVIVGLLVGLAGLAKNAAFSTQVAGWIIFFLGLLMQGIKYAAEHHGQK